MQTVIITYIQITAMTVIVNQKFVVIIVLMTTTYHLFI